MPAAAPTPLRAAATGAGVDETYVLAVDLGTGGPKVAVVSATGRIAAHAFEKVPLAAAPSRSRVTGGMPSWWPAGAP